MRVAVPVWNNRIAPVFDSAGTILLFDIQGTETLLRHVLALQGMNLIERARALGAYGVNELICGAISCEAESLVRAEGIEIHSFVAGEIEKILAAWMRDELEWEEFSMPGCRRLRRRRGKKHLHCHGI